MGSQKRNRPGTTWIGTGVASLLLGGPSKEFAHPISNLRPNWAILGRWLHLNRSLRVPSWFRFSSLPVPFQGIIPRLPATGLEPALSEEADFESGRLAGNPLIIKQFLIHWALDWARILGTQAMFRRESSSSYRFSEPGQNGPYARYPLCPRLVRSHEFPFTINSPTKSAAFLAAGYAHRPGSNGKRMAPTFLLARY